ncbi:autophagy-related protein 12, putative [Plasmodium gallinaceum]|uniref:Ubiquitin-like protein ATG12 n=1 Tax=Plasmodium gallinaceum TaxID=5849 RepID=A0A1J1GV30_PLAGA|nr:autophagy-related protein 12, putative [Plasmodium gallinaceum]CRG94898.1 autophagy-related protein 12, putative [Plasmodium gallinaceum]
MPDKIYYFPHFIKKPDMRESLTLRRNKKVKVVFRNISGATLLKKNKILINGNETFASILNFLQKIFNKNENIYLYINNAIKPNLDDFIYDLYELYKISDSLNISYSFTPAY